MTQHTPAQRRFGRSVLRQGAACLLSLCLMPAGATSFSAFVEFPNDQNTLLRGDGYPGQMRLLNHRGYDVCVYFRYKNAQGDVLRLSKVGNRIPASRQDLSVTGPGENSRSLEIAIDSAYQGRCGSLGESDGRRMVVVRAGEVQQGPAFEVDARSWSGSRRDITVHIR